MAANFLGRTRDAGATARVKGFLRSALALPEDSTVMVTELRCNEPGCPPLETVLAVLVDGGTRQRKVHKPLADVTEADVRAAWQAADGHPHDAKEHDEIAGEKKSENRI